MFEKETNNKKHSLPEDEGQSFTEIPATFDQKKFNLSKIMDYCATCKPWSIANEYETSRGNNKSLLRNYFQSASPAPEVQMPPDNISTLIADAMRVVRLISIAGLKPQTFKSWVDQIISYLSAIPGKHLHIIFDNYGYEYSVPKKQRNVSRMKRCITSLDQDLPSTKEWNEVLINQKNKLQIVNLVCEYIKSGAVAYKAVIVNQKSRCFFVNQTSTCVRIPELDSSHRKTDQKIPMDVPYAGQDSSNKICVMTDDTDIYSSLINIAHLVKSCLHFRQGKTKDKEGITYHDIHAIANYLGEDFAVFCLLFTL